MATAPQPPSPETLAYQEAMAKLAAGDLTAAVAGLLKLHTEHPDQEEGFFAEEQLTRIRKLWPEEAKKAGLTDEAWAGVESRAVARREKAKPVQGDLAVIALLVVIAAWSLAVAIVPRGAFLGRMGACPVDTTPLEACVPIIFRIVAVIAGLVSLATAFGLMKMKWEAVNVFIILSPVFMIITFIGLTEAGDLLGRVICVVALAAEVAAAWYMSKQARRFIY